MDSTSQNQEPENQYKRRGFPVYLENPSLAGSFPVRIKPQSPKKLEDSYMVAPGTGQVVASGAFAFVEEKEVDVQEFVKVYLDGIRQYGQLSKSGAMLFEVVYRELSGAKSKDKDTVTINYPLAQLLKPDLSRPTFFRGMKELLEKGFLFRSMGADNYFVNVRFMFNGDRLVVVKSYRRKSTKPTIDENQLDLFAAVPNALPVPKEEK